MNQAKKLRKTYFAALIALLLALVTMATATFAWYIYNTSAHTTEVHMAAGTSVYLEISNEYDGIYSTSTILESFTGRLIPVSSDRIVDAAGKVLFQECRGYDLSAAVQKSMIAKLFGEAPATAFYVTPLFLRVSGEGNYDIYVSAIDYTDDDETYPLSSASRVGLVIHEPGNARPVAGEYVFDINPQGKNPEAQYNTITGREGYVLDHRYVDGTTVEFKPLTSANFADYDKATGEVALRSASEKIMTLVGDGSAVQVDLYIWLEGCDEDCTNTLMGKTLKDVSISFAAVTEGSTAQ